MIKFENKSNGRYYYIFVTRDMLNDLLLQVAYGGKYHHRQRIISYGSALSIFKEINKIYQRRIRRGYEVVK